ncbi:MAG: MFS transporter [Comamonas sp.]|uniref:MFS transporter n=1 Tax=Comamonas sp. TaxID=34028 RepID=UPI002FC84E0B
MPSSHLCGAAPPSTQTPTLAPIWLLALAAGCSVANVYFAQPLLDALAAAFDISHGAVGGVVTATQLGCLLSLVLLVPLGDQIERRRLMLAQMAGLVLALGGVALASSATGLMVGMLAIGLMGTAMTQGLIAYAAAIAAPAERGRVVGVVQSGVFAGLLLARVFSGAVSDMAGWRGVYMVSAAGMLVLAVLLWRQLPVTSVHAQPTLIYQQLLASMWQLLRSNRVLQVRGMLALCMFAAFNIFWSALVLPLSAAPWSYSHTAIGAFGLVGVVGALAATRAGHWADRGWSQRTTLAALLVLLLAWWPLAYMPQSVMALMLGIVLLDMGGQALHVVNQHLIFQQSSSAPSRLVGLYMLFYAAGSGAGALGATAMYAHHGWLGVCALGAAVSCTALLWWWMTRRYGQSTNG